MAENNEPAIAAKTPNEIAEEVMAMLSHLRSIKFPFSNDQMDELISIPLAMLPKEDQAILREAADQNSCPLWQAVVAQFRRTNEQGFAYSLLLDPGWIQAESLREDIAECPECGDVFIPSNPGQKFCSSRCGSAKEVRASQEATKRANDNQVAIEKSQGIDIDGADFKPETRSMPNEPKGFIPIGVENLASQIRS